jgi:hypothetical protein
MMTPRGSWDGEVQTTGNDRPLVVNLPDIGDGLLAGYRRA